jgi:hypothetical protein
MIAQIVIAALVVSAVFLGGFGRIARLPRRGQEMVALCIFAVAVVSLTSIYYYCYVQSATGILGYFSAFLRSLFGAIAAVVNVSSDYAAIAPVLNSNPVLTLVYWLAIMLAVSAFILAIAAIFGRKLIDSLRWRISFKATRYLIIGCDEETLALGMNIASRDRRLATGKTDRRRIVRYLACSGDALDLETVLARTQDFGGIVAEFSPLTLARDMQILGKLRKLGVPGALGVPKVPGVPGVPERAGGSQNGSKRNHLIVALPSPFDTMQALEQIEDCAATGTLSRHRLAIHVVSDSATVAKAVANLARSLDIQCLSRDELLIRSYLDAYPPYRLLDVSRSKPTGDFTVAICGFGNFGQRFLDHLIQNGQFLGSRMKALLIDPEIAARVARYRHRRPALDLCLELLTEDAELCSMRLLDFLGRRLDELDLIFIDTTDGGAGGDVGVSTSSSRELAEDIADLIFTRSPAISANRPLLVVKDEDGLTVLKGDQRRIFAYRSEVFSEANLINSALDDRARLVNYVYCCAPDGGPNAPADCAPDGGPDAPADCAPDGGPDAPAPARLPYPGATAIDRQWEEVRDAFTQNSNRATAAFLPALAALANKSPTYADLKQPISADQELLEQLAENEHLRWLAFHVVNGWQPLSLKDMELECVRLAAAADNRAAIKGFQKTAKRQHACMVPFGEIDAVSQRYNQLLQQYGSTAPKRDFAYEDAKIIRYLEWINSHTKLYGSRGLPF